MKRCTVCGNEYESWMQFCPRDSSELVTPSEPAGAGTPAPDAATSGEAAPDVATSEISLANVSTPGVSTPGAEIDSLATRANVSTPGVPTPGVSTPGVSTPGASAPSGPAPIAGAERPHATPLPDFLDAPEGRYREIETVARTPIGDVRLAEDTILGRKVSLLLVSADLAEEDLRGLYRRYRAISGVTHPNLGTVYSLERIDGKPAGVVEHIEGPYLDDLLAAEAPFDAVRAAALARQLAGALCAMHEAGIFHQDVRPANVIINTRGTLKLINFCQALVGSSAQKSARPTDGLLEKLRWLGPGSDPVREIAYAAPEQLRGGPVDARADVYGVGAVLYHMLTGAPPFAGETVYDALAAVTSDAPVRPVPRSSLEGELVEVALRCLAKRPEDRFATAHSLERAFDDLERRLQIASLNIDPITPTQIAPPDALAASIAAVGRGASEDAVETRVSEPLSAEQIRARMGAELPYPGEVIDGKYRVDAVQGRGGMGAVYRATDLDLERPVAIKVLHPQLVNDDSMMRRFRQEARSAARLRHPNAVTVYGFGQLASGAAYMAMELIEGVTLRDEMRRNGRLSLEETAHILGQVADAIAAAHEVGLVHRDIKPDNIMLESRPGGIAAKVLDFGIAKLLTTTADGDRLTVPQAIVGTPVYMSPEQARGDTIDARADIYSLGVVLFEMLAGDVPFHADTPVGLALKHVTDAPPALRSLAPEVPEAVEAVIMGALAKDPNDRPQTALDLANIFWESVSALGAGDGAAPAADTARPSRVGPRSTSPTGFARPATRTTGSGSVDRPASGADRSASPDEPTIAAASPLAIPGLPSTPVPTPAPEDGMPVVAVLPLRSLSADPEDVFFADGLTEELITALARVRGVAVVSRTSTLRYKDSTEPLRTIGAALGATHVLEGSVRRHRDRVRVSAQFADVARDVQIWGETYDRTLEDVFAVQTEVARSAAESVSAALPECGSKACNMHPYDVWLEGRQVLQNEYFATFDPEALDRATALFEESLALDERFPDAWTFLGIANFVAAIDRGERSRFEAVERCAARAIEIDPAHPGAPTLLGWLAHHRGKGEEALANFRRAIALNPGIAEPRVGLGVALKLRGLWDAAERELERAAELNPMHTSPAFNMVDISLWRGDVEAARAHLNRAKQIDRFSHVTARKEATLAYAAGDYAEALRLLEGVVGARALGQRASGKVAAALAHTRMHAHEAAHAALDEEAVEWAKNDPLGAEMMAQVRALEGDAAEAVEWLRRSIMVGNENYPWIAANPDFEPVRGDAEFEALVSPLRARWEADSSALAAGRG